MYSREEASQIRKKFWTKFGQYMKLHPGASDRKNNWINYKTGIPNLRFRTDVDNKTARTWIEINHRDLEMQELMYEQFLELESYFKSTFGEEWIWFDEAYDDTGLRISKIEKRIEKVSIFREEDWPEIISFLKENLLLLDEFWNDVRDIFEVFK